MSKIIFAILAALTLALSAAAQGEAINWQTDYKQALASARETGKPLMLDFSASWCKPCKAMERDFWVRADVVEATKPFIAVKLDLDKERFLAAKYGVQAIPFVAFTDPLGNMVTFRRGFGTKNADELSQIFNEMPKDFSALKQSYEAVEVKKDDGLALLKIADFYRNSGMLILSNDFYKKAAKTAEIQSDAEVKERIAVTLGLNLYRSKDFKQAKNYLEDYLKDFPSGKYKEITFAMLAIGNANLGKMKDADKYLEMLKTDFPASKTIETTVKAVEDAKNKPKE